MTTEENKPTAKRKKRRRSVTTVRFRDLLVGTQYQTKTTGQTLQILAMNVKEQTITYKALTTVRGPGAGRAAAAGEVRTVTNAHQWVTKLRTIAPLEAAAEVLTPAVP